METAEALISVATWYAVAGLVVGVVFLLIGLNRVEPAGHGTYLFRVLLVPGLVLLWPLVLIRWAMLERRKSA